MPNRLADETSPYLRQHAENPVDWYPWGAEALARARAEDKPILLSIGYSACHWCHVMAHESFEDAATADVMNRLFVNVKVDREERPDLDHVYQLTHQLIARRGGGWPLTVFLSPDLTPFFSGTYFPPQPRHGLPAFRDLLARVENFYRTRRADIGEQSEAIRDALARMEPAAPGEAMAWSGQPVGTAAEALRAQFDTIDGGFGGAPKFPQPHLLAFYLRHQSEQALFTLRKMAEGGIYDQVGGGFCRYSVDGQWMIPHFEKMLYDNGLLLALYADAYVLSRETLFARVAEQTVEWALREMRAADGGFFSALDADSEGEEGRFYVWARNDVRALLTADEFAVVAPHYGLDSTPNFEGHWHLHVAKPLDEVAHGLGRSRDEVRGLLDSARAKLFAARSARVRPGLDDKILTAWNALMIRGLARAARVFDRADWLAAAQRAVDFLRRDVWREGKLFATYQGGQPRHAGYLDDHAFLLDALLEQLQTSFRRADYDFALALARALLERFEDRAAGGFFFTSHDHEALLHRSKPVEDHSIPSGNGVAAFALQRLAHLSGDPAHAAAAQRCLRLFHAVLRESPHYVPTLLGVLEETLAPPQSIVLRGPAGELPAWQRALAARYLPHTMVFAVPSEERDLPALLSPPAGDRVQAYVCTGTSCLPPVEDLNALASMLPRAV
jgi:hypothetical protein